MTDRIDQIIPNDDTVEAQQENAVILEDPHLKEHFLHIPDAEGKTKIAEKDLSVYCKTGLLPLPPSGKWSQPSDLIPAILHPYLGDKLFRRPWPLLLNYSRSGPRTETLRSVIDGLVEAIEDEGDAGKYLKRAYFRLEQLLTEASLKKQVSGVHSVLSGIESRLKKKTAERSEQAEANALAIESLRNLSSEDSLIFGYGESGLRQLMVAVSVRISDGRHRAFKEDVEWLRMRLEDLLLVEKEDSEEGRTPEKLEHSVGGAYARAIDFSSLSDLLDDVPRGAAIESERRERIEQTLADLARLSAGLYSDGRKECFLSSEEAQKALQSRIADFTRLARAKQVAQLEIENLYRAEVHDPLFEAFEYDSIPIPERKAFPPVLIHLHDDMIDGVESMLRALGDAGTMRVLITYSSLFDAHAVPSIGMDVARSALVRGNVFVQQSTASQAEFVARGMQLSAREKGSSLLSIYTGSDCGNPEFDGFMAAALASDSRTVPSFRFDPEKGADWADRFSASENEQSGLLWASELIDVKCGDAVESRSFVTTTADVLSFDARFARHFLVVDTSFQSPDLIELSQYLDLDDSSRMNKLPFIWERDTEDCLLRVVLAPTIVRAADNVRDRWKMIQEWSGLNSSILKRGLQESDESARKRIDEAIARAQAEFDLKMNESTNSLAHRIVENIAASLLGLQSANLPVMGAARPPAPAENPSLAVEESQPSRVEAEEEDEDDPGISLDEAYIDTPQCTACNECTDLNGIMFGYNEDKQAFIKDAAAGPYRDMVLAAEKCPVRIIHPGKPLDESEKYLDEWIERAQPFL